MTSLSVVIPVYNNWKGVHALLFDLYQKCSLIEEVIVLDDASPDPEVQKGLAWWKSTNMLPLEVVTQKEDLGFLRNSNMGLKMAVEDTVILISSDVRVHKDIVEYSSNLGDDLLIGGRIIDWDSGWNYGKPYVEGWILGATKASWEKLGYFDDRYAPCDVEDVDLSVTATKLQFTLTTYPEGYVSHVGAQSIPYGEKREAGTIINKEKFRQKWSLK